MLMQPCLCVAHNWGCRALSGDVLQCALIPSPSLKLLRAATALQMIADFELWILQLRGQTQCSLRRRQRTSYKRCVAYSCSP